MNGLTRAVDSFQKFSNVRVQNTVMMTTTLFTVNDHHVCVGFQSKKLPKIVKIAKTAKIAKINFFKQEGCFSS